MGQNFILPVALQKSKQYEKGCCPEKFNQKSWCEIGMERTPDPDTSGNRCATLDQGYPTQLRPRSRYHSELFIAHSLCHFLTGGRVFVVSKF